MEKLAWRKVDEFGNDVWRLLSVCGRFAIAIVRTSNASVAFFAIRLGKLVGDAHRGSEHLLCIRDVGVKDDEARKVAGRQCVSACQQRANEEGTQ